MIAAPNAATKDRLLAAAAELFAAHGFQGTTMRQLAERSGVNLAASHYHYGSKRDLYLEVLRGYFAEIRAEVERQGAALTAEKVGGMSRTQLLQLLRTRVRIMLGLLVGPPPGMAGALMQREMCDPSDALPVIVDEFIRPNLDELNLVISQLAPNMSPQSIEDCTFSIVGQILYYRYSMPAVLHLKRRKGYPRDLATRLTDHIVEFSLGGLERLARPTKTRRERREH